MYADIMRSRQQDYSSQMQHCFFMHEDLVYVDNNSYVVVIYCYESSLHLFFLAFVLISF